MQAREMMTRDVVCTIPDASIREVFEIMRELRVRHMPVVAGGTLLGIVSDRDVLPYTRQGRVVEERIVEEVMSECPVVANKKTSIARMADMMLELRIDALPITEATTLVGLVTTTDMLILLRSPPETLAEVIPFQLSVRTHGGVQLPRS